MFVGTHHVSVDGKGRLSVPAPFRAALKGADLIYVWPSYQGPWLEGGDAALLARLHDALDARGELDDVRDDFAYAIFAEARALAFDETGRASLPDDLRAHARLNGKAAFAGLSDRFEIWSPTLLEERVNRARAAAADKRGLINRLSREGAG
jgi:MraZ protein